MTKAIQQKADRGFGTWLMDLPINRQTERADQRFAFQQRLANKILVPISQRYPSVPAASIVGGDLRAGAQAP
jgi:hypothetical protein